MTQPKQTPWDEEIARISSESEQYGDSQERNLTLVALVGQRKGYLRAKAENAPMLEALNKMTLLANGYLAAPTTGATECISRIEDIGLEALAQLGVKEGQEA